MSAMCSAACLDDAMTPSVTQEENDLRVLKERTNASIRSIAGEMNDWLALVEGAKNQDIMLQHGNLSPFIWPYDRTECRAD